MSDGATPAGGALVDAIVSVIRGRIMSGEIPPGEQLRQEQLAAELGVSRTPVREALRQLRAGRLIEMRPRRGAVVRVPTPWEIREAYEVRAELEALACARAASRVGDAELARLRSINDAMRATVPQQPRSGLGDAMPTPVDLNDAFHTLIHVVAGNEYLVKMIEEVNHAFPRDAINREVLKDPRLREQNVREHERIVEALSAGDGELARGAMTAHVMRSGELLAEWYASGSGRAGARSRVPDGRDLPADEGGRAA